MQAGILVKSTGSEILITELPAIVSIFKIVSESKPEMEFCSCGEMALTFLSKPEMEFELKLKLESKFRPEMEFGSIRATLSIFSFNLLFKCSIFSDFHWVTN